MDTLQILGIKISNINDDELLSEIIYSIIENKKLFITYANANTLNLSYKNKNFRNLLNWFDVVHPDGIGAYLGSKILLNNKGLKKRISGSDFYPRLTEELIKGNWKVFFFGHTEKILHKIKSKYPNLNICGFAEGYNFHPINIVKQINDKSPDILIIGLGQPLQEEVISFYKDFIGCKVIMAVGDGIKVFAGEKLRGPVFMRKLGLEWVVRLISNPFKYWKRYLVGNPLFLYRIIRAKIGKFNP